MIKFKDTSNVACAFISHKMKYKLKALSLYESALQDYLLVEYIFVIIVAVWNLGSE